jgi:hypothetical protein
MKLYAVELPTFKNDEGEILEWACENIGQPFEHSKEPNFHGFDYTQGAWGCYMGYNRYQVGYDSPDLKDNWVFKNERDANWFALRWT